MDEKVDNVLRNQGDTIHPLDVPERRKIARAPGSLTVYHTTRLCERLMQPKSEFDLTDPRGFMMSSEYNSLHDPNLRSYLYRKDIHRRLIRGGFITKDDKVVCSLRTLNTYRNYLADVERGWGRRFRMEQKELVRTFLTLQEKGKISTDVTMTDVTDWLVQSGQSFLANQHSASKSRSMSGLRLQQLPAIAKRCSAIEISPAATGRSVLNWSNKGIQMMQEVTKEVQREMRLDRRWAASKKEKEKKKGEQSQKKLKKGIKTSKSKKDSQEKEIENHLGGHGEHTRSMDEPSSQISSPKQISPRQPTANLCERRDQDVHQDVERSLSVPKVPCLQSPPYDSADRMFYPTENERVYYNQQNSPRNVPLDRQSPFADAKKKLSAVCQKLITEPTSPPTPSSSCGIIREKITSARSVSSRLVNIRQTLLEEHFKGVVTPEELQVVLQGIVVSLVEEVNQVLVPAIVTFQYERMLASSSPLVLPPCFAMSSSSSFSSKISPVTSSSLCTTPEVYVTYPDYTSPNCTGVCHVEMPSSSSPEDIQEDERHSFGKKVVAPTASLLLKVENIIKDVIKDSVEIFTKEMTLVNTMQTVSFAEDTEAEAKSGVKIKEEKPEVNTEMEDGVKKTDVANAVFIDATDVTTAATTNTTAATTESDVSKMPEEVIQSDIVSSESGSDSGSDFVVSLEKSIWLSSKQVDEVLEKVTSVLDDERTYWLSSESPESEGGRASVETALPPPNSLIFAIIQKMQLDKYLERKLMSFFAGQQLSSPTSGPLSPVDSFSPDTHENLPWSSLSTVSPHSIKVTKWLLQTIQRRNGWQGSMNSDLDGMDSRQVREKHILCEVIQALLDHLNNLSTMKSLSRQTQSDSSLCPQGSIDQSEPVSANKVLSDMSLAASELTKDVMSKLLLEDSD